MANKTLIYNYNIDNSFSQSVEAFDNIIVNNIFEDNFAVNDAQDFVYGILEEEADRYLTEAEKVEINQLITNSDYHYLIGDGML